MCGGCVRLIASGLYKQNIYIKYIELCDVVSRQVVILALSSQQRGYNNKKRGLPGSIVGGGGGGIFCCEKESNIYGTHKFS